MAASQSTILTYQPYTRFFNECILDLLPAIWNATSHLQV